MGITQLNFEGKNKVEVAIEFIKAFEPVVGYYLADSGGKDSGVVRDLTIRSGVKFDAHYCVSPIDPKEIHDFLKEHHPDTVWDFHARGFWKLVIKKGLPLRQARWCCQIIKEAGGKNRFVIVGNRREEGTVRRHQQCLEKGYKYNKYFVRPILEWTQGEVWEYTHTYNVDYCSLYDNGFKRLGCVLCPFARNVEQEMLHFPKITNLWRRACDHIVERRLASGKEYKHTFQTGQELFNWWISRQ